MEQDSIDRYTGVVGLGNAATRDATDLVGFSLSLTPVVSEPTRHYADHTHRISATGRSGQPNSVDSMGAGGMWNIQFW